MSKAAPLTAKGKNKMLRNLLEHGLDEKKLKEALFDQAVMAGERERVYSKHYAPERKKMELAIRNISALQNNQALDWIDSNNNEQLQSLKDCFAKKRNELHPEPKGKSYLAAVGAKVVNLFNIILPVVEKNNRSGRKKYSLTDIYKLISGLWHDTYGLFVPGFTHDQIKHLYENNKSKIPIKI